MFWGLSETWWQELWGGVIGSFVAAVLGGLVALLVVRLTNRQQQRSAEEARETAAISDFVAIVTGFIYSHPHAEERDISEFRTNAQAAAVRLQLASKRVTPLYKAISNFPHLISMLGAHYGILTAANRLEEAETCGQAINYAASSLFVTMPLFFTSTETGRRAALDAIATLEGVTEKVQKDMEGRIDKMVREATAEKDAD